MDFEKRLDQKKERVAEAIQNAQNWDELYFALNSAGILTNERGKEYSADGQIFLIDKLRKFKKDTLHSSAEIEKWKKQKIGENHLFFNNITKAEGLRKKVFELFNEGL